MRQDARSLLERLGKSEFRYQEFDDQFADMELWPIFEALLRDDNVVGQKASAVRLTEIQFKPSAAADSTDAEPVSASPAKSLSGIFDRYGDAVPPSAAPPINLRQYFNRFSEGE